MEKILQIMKPDAGVVQKIRRSLKCTPVLATILANRNITSPEEAFSFLNGSFREIRPPFSIKDMDIAVRRISTAIIRHEKVLIFGDYDVDGVTSTTLLYEFFKYIGADVSYYIPHRIDEGYGLQAEHIANYALPNGVNLIITTDCGSSSHDAVKIAKENGIDVIITDHHNISTRLPDAVATINPKRHDCPSGLKDLSGAGVAFYLLICLRKHLRETGFWSDRTEPNLKDICDLVALGTIADIVPLVNENRIFTKAGIQVISTGNRPGIKALLEECNISKPCLESEDIAFRLAPRLNAAGRLNHAKISVELLTATDMEEARRIARTLNEMNQKRQEYEKKIIEEILSHIAINPSLLEKKTLVMANARWHEGVLGIAASKLAKKFVRPVVLISTKDGMGKGSARSIPEFDLYEGLLACGDELVSFGGHSMAAGLRIKTANISQFHRKLETLVSNKTVVDDFKEKTFIDFELNFSGISDVLFDEIETLGPFGAMNPEPLFLARNVKIVSSAIVGKTHRRMVLSQADSKGKKAINAIHFNINASQPLPEEFDQVVFRLRWNYWNDKKSAQIVIEQI